jgi:hypothetical protein
MYLIHSIVPRSRATLKYNAAYNFRVGIIGRGACLAMIELHLVARRLPLQMKKLKNISG